MRAAIPLTSDTIDAQLSLRFARCPYLAIVDTLTASYEIIGNVYSQMKSGAGRSLVEFLVSVKQVNALVAFELGLYVQQKAKLKELQLIIINNKNSTLNDLLELLNIKILNRAAE